MKKFLTEYGDVIRVAIIAANGLAYGLSDFLAYTKTLSISIPILLIVCYYFFKKTNKVTEYESTISTLDQIIGDSSQVIDEQQRVIDEYENIFDSQLVHLPCVCGGNTFEGLFSPNTENVVECEKCKNKYKVTVNYDSVLISEPLDLNKPIDTLLQ